jgi:MFS family permease
MNPAASTAELSKLIAQKRADVEAFLLRAQPRKRRLLNMTIVGGTLAAALTAGPAVGGQSFTGWLTQTLNMTSPSWRLLCAAAALSSIMATVATQLLKADNVEENIARAQGCRAKLEVLEVALSVGQLDLQQATAEYLKCVEAAAFLDR